VNREEEREELEELTLAPLKLKTKRIKDAEA
jgi:hypothetical protein